MNRAASALAILALGMANIRGQAQEAIPVPPGAAQTVAVLASGDLLLAGTTLACLDSRDLKVRWTRPLEDAPATCAVGLPERGFLTASKRQVRVHAADGAVSDVWGDLGEQAWVTALAVGDGTVFVCDAGQRAVWRFNTGGELLGRIPANAEAEADERFTVPSPFFDAVYADGAFWVANPGAHEVRRYSATGASLEGRWGFASMQDPGGFAGCCNPIHLAVLPKGGLATAEKGIPRIKEHTAQGHLVRIIADPTALSKKCVLADLAVGQDGTLYALDGQNLRMFSTERK